MSGKESMKDTGREDPAGPQGTRVFSGEEVKKLVESADQAGPAGQRVRLVGRSGPLQGQEIGLRDSRLVLGRSAECDVFIDEASVSSEHARLSRDSGGWRVVNLLSTNGTFVNGKRVSSAPLTDGDILRLGRMEFIFHEPGGHRSDSNNRSVARRLVTPLVLAGAVVVMLLALGGLYRLI